MWRGTNPGRHPWYKPVTEPIGVTFPLQDTDETDTLPTAAGTTHPETGTRNPAANHNTNTRE